MFEFLLFIILIAVYPILFIITKRLLKEVIENKTFLIFSSIIVSAITYVLILILVGLSMVSGMGC